MVTSPVSTKYLMVQVHVLEYHYSSPDGKPLTDDERDDERVSARRPLKIYDNQDDVLHSSRKAKVNGEA
jgi:hypothetical protein